MQRFITLQALFKRYRRPGDIVFATLFLAFSAYLLSQLGEQTTWKSAGKLAAQAPFWPMISLGGMTVFAALHLAGSVLSPRLPGRWAEVAFWLRSIEYALWFMLYVLLVPQLGYLPSTLLVAVALALRAGYRSRAGVGGAALAAVVVVVLFKSILKVNVPGGALYEFLPDALRAFMLTWL